MEFCINCSNEVEHLNDVTGWCNKCSGKEVCSQCGLSLNPATLNNGRHTCDRCTKEKWLNDHADELEALLVLGFSLTAAKKQIYDTIRPLCLVCEQEIPYAKENGRFCSRTEQCRSARRRYRTLREGALHLRPQVALEQTLRELGKLL